MSIEQPPPAAAHTLDPAAAMEVMREYERARFEAEHKDAIFVEEATPSRVLGVAACHVETTAQPETLARYEQRGSQLFHRYLRERGMAHETMIGDTDATRFVTWLFALKPTLKATTWRMYRSAVNHYLELAIGSGSNIPEALALLERDATIRSRDAVSGSRRSRGTLPGNEKRNSSSLKMKKIPQTDMRRLMAWLRVRSRSRWARDTATWLSAGLLCGLRPSEWERTHIQEIEDQMTLYGRRVWLYVICAKATNGRGFATSRTLDLSTFDDDSLNRVREMVALARKWRQSGTFAENQSSCAQLLANAVQSLWPRRKMSISLYSARHQAIANWKAAGIPRVAIAVMAGHDSIMTAAEKYGRRSSGWTGVKALPAAVREELAIAYQNERAYADRMLMVRDSTTRPSSTPSTSAPGPAP